MKSNLHQNDFVFGTNLPRLSSTLTTPQFVRPSSNRAVARARFATDPLGELWTPRLLDRLQSPLTRFRY